MSTLSNPKHNQLNHVLTHPIERFRLQKSRTNILLAGFILLVAFIGWAVRIWYHQFDRIDWDGYFYLAYARHIAQGNIFLPSPAWTIYPPGYPALIALVAALGVSFEAAAVFVSQLAGVLLMLLVVGVLATRYGWRSAIVAAFLFVVDNVLVVYNNAVLSESVFTLLFWVLILYWLPGHVIRRGEFWSLPTALWSALLIALLISTRSIALIFVLPYLAIFGIGGLARRQFFLALAAIILAVLLVAGNMLFARQVAATLQSTYGTAVPDYAQQEIGRGLHEVGYAVVETHGGLAGFMLSNRGALARMWLQKVLALFQAGPQWTLDMSARPVVPFWALPCIGFGMFTLARRYPRSVLQWLPVVLLLASYLVVIPLFTADVRYYMPLLPGALVLAAIGLAEIWQSAAKSLHGYQAALAQLVAIAIFVAFALMASYRLLPHDPAIANNPWLEAGRWAQTVRQPALVLVQNPAPAYFMNAQPVWIESAQPADVLRQAQKANSNIAAVQCPHGEQAHMFVQSWIDAGWLLGYRANGSVYDACIFIAR